MSGSFPSSRPDWSNMDVIHRGVLPSRSYFSLYESEADALSSNGPCSLNLGGTWKFHYSDSPFNAPQGFEDTSYDVSQWKEIQVPGHWQLQGWGKPHYSNVNFIIPIDPPNVPFNNNQTGSYVRKFTVPSSFEDQYLRLRFEGVDSGFHVYLNGKELGYSQGARNPTEFDITSLVDFSKENTVAVRVYQYCDGSYLEDQDQWRLNGIFRDVLLQAFPKTHIEDFDVQTLLDDNYKNADLKVNLITAGSGLLTLKLLDHDKQTVVTESKQISSHVESSTSFSIAIDNPKKWSAEDPYLYKLVISFGDRFIVQNVGFRKIEIKDGLLKVNGKRIVFLGVNRHEHHPLHGRAVPYEFMKKDLLTMKQHNINSIRTSHYPSDPRLYSLADALGFWILDEADLECHGFSTIDRVGLSEEDKRKSYIERIRLIYGKSARWTTNNPEWRAQYVDRALQLCSRDKNHPSVIMWSLGNEAFYGCNIQSMYDAIKAIDPTRPIHYEGDTYSKTTDLFSQMYLTPEEMIEFAQEPNFTKPLIVCEYGHAMGNGPGNLKEYIDVFYQYPRLQGGMIWEWASQGLTTKNPETGEDFYAYGGDFGDEPNNYNFILDGLVFSDHSPAPGLIEYKKAIEPVQIVGPYKDGKITISNRYDFVSLDHLQCEVVLIGDGVKRTLGEIAIPPGVSPHKTADLTIPKFDISEVTGEAYLQVDFCLKNSTLWADSGHPISSSQVQIRGPTDVVRPPPSSPPPRLETTSNALEITTATSSWTFSLSWGKLISWKKSNVELIHANQGPEFDIQRAMTDNDRRWDGLDWVEKFVALCKSYTQSVTWSINTSTSSIEVIVQSRFAPLVLSWSINTTTTYVFRSDGTFSIHCKGAGAGENLPLVIPRLGFTLAVPKSLDTVKWFGRGPGESYKDKKLSQNFGNWSSTVDDLFTNYEFPQESGNRTDVRWVQLSSAPSDNAKGNTSTSPSLKASFGTQPGFSFTASHYTWKDLEDAKHPYDLAKKKKDYTILRLDADHHGLGTGSCGPKTREEYALKPGAFDFVIELE